MLRFLLACYPVANVRFDYSLQNLIQILELKYSETLHSNRLNWTTSASIFRNRDAGTLFEHFLNLSVSLDCRSITRLSVLVSAQSCKNIQLRNLDQWSYFSICRVPACSCNICRLRIESVLFLCWTTSEEVFSCRMSPEQNRKLACFTLSHGLSKECSRRL